MEGLEERLILMNLLAKDSTGMAFVVADVVVEAAVEVMTVVLLLKMGS
jgi:ACT domain-containing protein